MIRFVFIAVLAAGIAADVYLYKRYVSALARCRGIRLLYLFAAIVVNGTLPAMMAADLLLGGDNTTRSMHVSMWITFAYILLTFPKFVFCLLSFLDVLLERRGVVGRSHLFALAGCALSLWAAWGIVRGCIDTRTDIEVTRLEVRSDKLPAAFDGLRAVFFSDPHIGSLVHPHRSLRAMVDTINSLQPDLVINGGDLVNVRYTELTPEITGILAGIKAPHGIYSVLGNHDLGIYIKDSVSLPPHINRDRLIAKQREMGWHVLCDQTELFTIPERDSTAAITITGVNFPEDFLIRQHNPRMVGADLDKAFAGVSDSLFNLTVSHAPQLWGQLTDRGISDLTLSGHVHSMQMKFRLFGREFSPASLLYKQWSGEYRRGDKVLYINDGFGCVGYPIRIGARPEITLITLRR